MVLLITFKDIALSILRLLAITSAKSKVLIMRLISWQRHQILRLWLVCRCSWNWKCVFYQRRVSKIQITNDHSNRANLTLLPVMVAFFEAMWALCFNDGDLREKLLAHHTRILHQRSMKNVDSFGTSDGLPIYAMRSWLTESKRDKVNYQQALVYLGGLLCTSVSVPVDN